MAGERHQWAGEYTLGGIEDRVFTTGELYRMPMRENGGIRFRISTTSTSQALLPIDPYLYGYWLGNGCATRPEITVRTGDVEHVTEQIPYEISNSWLNVGDSRVLRIPALKEILLKSHRDKQIEPSHLRVSKSQRI